jgi:sugar-phosphatase
VNFECRALLFDMDGVLVDSTAHIAAVWRGWARERGVDEDAVIAVAHGRRSSEVLRIVAPHLATPQEVELLEALDAHDEAGIVPIAGANALLKALPPQVWAVVTSATAPLARRRLMGAGLPPPPVLVAADDVGVGKPAPDGYLEAARLLGVGPTECIVFEDAPPGIAAARAAGMRVVGVATTFAIDELSHADAVIGSLEQVEVAVRNGCLQLQVAHVK